MASTIRQSRDPHSGASRRSTEPARADNPTITEEQIATLAHVLWENRGRPEGSAMEDWLVAEQELRRNITGHHM